VGVQLAVVGRVHRGGGEGGGEGRVGHELRRDHTHLTWFYVVVAMRVVGLEGFLTYEHHTGAVVGVCVVA